MKSLGQIPEFKILEKKELLWLESQLNSKRILAGKTISHQGEINNDIIFLNDGILSAVYSTDKKIHIRDFYFSGNFGLSSFELGIVLQSSIWQVKLYFIEVNVSLILKKDKLY